MSAHDSHAPVQDTKGIWTLPLAAWIIVLILLVAFTRPIFHHAEESTSHEKTEKPHSKAEEAETSHH
ncbi:hypothetical protein EV200_102480 [Pedobacter psychrotolerans]|uniref:Uncharacterized protein n=1 Tax=Pedobacter psychrotolerans TaxID=1843235 RepID=A0A4R2HIE6_9SPHI|nr:hypothetical protein [Pedobacter psychrotolerans]TCO29061.1 hypothetical protein EV200_102480 [Pedobacter psychrotolerans]GGE53831.1 hypothetical protein GCM10011413_20270 [Pedobacter psychrotolerans]